jgi:hypothetical protein
MPEYRFNKEIGRFPEYGYTGDLHCGCGEPEYPDNDMPQEMVVSKTLQKQARRKHKEGKKKDSQSDIKSYSRILRAQIANS